MAIIGIMCYELRVHACIQRLKSFSKLRALNHVVDGNKAAIPGKPDFPDKVKGFSAGGPPKSKWWDKKHPGNHEKSPFPKSSKSGGRVCGSPDHWQLFVLPEEGNGKRQNGRRDN